jgi:hypothetical protein
MSEQENKLLALGRLNKRTKEDGTVYFTGNLLVRNASKGNTPLKEVETFTDKSGNTKIGIVVFPNKYKQDEADADFKIFESRKPDDKPEPPAKKEDDLPF